MSTVPTGVYTILNLYSKNALQAWGGENTVGRYVVASPASVHRSQVWNVIYVAAYGGYVIHNVDSGLYLSTKQVTATPVNGHQTFQTDNEPQYFNFTVGTENGAYFIFPLSNPGLVLDLMDYGTAENTVIIQNRQNPYAPPRGNRNQQWCFVVRTAPPNISY